VLAGGETEGLLRVLEVEFEDPCVAGDDCFFGEECFDPDLGVEEDGFWGRGFWAAG